MSKPMSLFVVTTLIIIPFAKKSAAAKKGLVLWY